MHGFLATTLQTPSHIPQRKASTAMPPSEPDRPLPQDGEVPASQPIFQSDELFRGHREVLILHCGETYRLRLTRNGKLILTK